MAGILNYTKDFVTKALPIVCGVPQGYALSANKSRYMVVVHAHHTPTALGEGPEVEDFTICGWLQEKFEITTGSNWESVGQLFSDGISKAIDSLSQMTIGRSMVSQIATRRKWNGSDPIQVKMKLKFEAINDVLDEVLRPCMGLQMMTLPRAGRAKGFFVIPPGPNPYYMKLGVLTLGVEERGELIDIDIGGGFIHFDKIIMKDVSVVYENRMSAKGPIGAEATITFETYEMLTKEGLQAAYANAVVLVGKTESVAQAPKQALQGASSGGTPGAATSGLTAPVRRALSNLGSVLLGAPTGLGGWL